MSAFVVTAALLLGIAERHTFLFLLTLAAIVGALALTEPRR